MPGESALPSGMVAMTIGTNSENPTFTSVSINDIKRKQKQEKIIFL